MYVSIIYNVTRILNILPWYWKNVLKETNVSIESGLRFVVCIVMDSYEKAVVIRYRQRSVTALTVSCLSKTVGNLKNIGILVNRWKSSMISMIRFNDNQCFEQLSLLHVTAFEFRDIWKNMSVILSRGRSSVRVGIDCQPPKTAIIKKRRLTDRKQNQTYRLRSDERRLRV